MRVVTVTTLAAALAALAACRLDPLVDDVQSGSAHLLPAGAAVPSALDHPDLASQIALNSGLDARSLMAAGNVAARGTGQSGGAAVRYWAFGRATNAPSPLYELYRDTGTGLVRVAEHPAFVDALPGDAGYSPLHTLVRVVVTDAYRGELITSPEALADAIELGLVATPAPSGTFIASPLVLPNVKLDVGGAEPVAAEVVFGKGRSLGMFRFGGALGVQPTARGFAATSQVSYLREAQKPSFDTSRPIFLAGVPASAPVPPAAANYSALSAVIQVELAPGTSAASIRADSDLFVRTGATITSTTAAVARFEVLPVFDVLPMQFAEGAP